MASGESQTLALQAAAGLPAEACFTVDCQPLPSSVPPFFSVSHSVSSPGASELTVWGVRAEGAPTGLVFQADL